MRTARVLSGLAGTAAHYTSLQTITKSGQEPINVVFPPGLLSSHAAKYCSRRKSEKAPLTHKVSCLMRITMRVFSCPLS